MDTQQALDRERALLGALLLDPALVPFLANELGPEDFLDVAHARAFRTLLALDAKGVVPNLEAVERSLEETRELEDLGGPAGLADLVRERPALWQTLASLEVARLQSGRGPATRLDAIARGRQHRPPPPAPVAPPEPKPAPPASTPAKTTARARGPFAPFMTRVLGRDAASAFQTACSRAIHEWGRPGTIGAKTSFVLREPPSPFASDAEAFALAAELLDRDPDLGDTYGPAGALRLPGYEAGQARWLFFGWAPEAAGAARM